MHCFFLSEYNHVFHVKLDKQSSDFPNEGIKVSFGLLKGEDRVGPEQS